MTGVVVQTVGHEELDGNAGTLLAACSGKQND
jgi:hypothetical protein